MVRHIAEELGTWISVRENTACESEALAVLSEMCKCANVNVETLHFVVNFRGFRYVELDCSGPSFLEETVLSHLVPFPTLLRSNFRN